MSEYLENTKELSNNKPSNIEHIHNKQVVDYRVIEARRIEGI